MGKITREEYDKAVQVIEAYGKQLEEELQEVKKVSLRRAGFDMDTKTIQAPKSGDIIEITEAFGSSENLKVGTRHKVSKAILIRHKNRVDIVTTKGITVKSHLYSFRVA